MGAQMKKGNLDLCVLAILSQANCYGYELVEKISRHIQLAEGTIYPLLKRCLSDGWLESYLQESDQGPPRKYYRLTEIGRDVYADIRSEWDDYTNAMTKLLKEVDSYERA